MARNGFACAAAGLAGLMAVSAQAQQPVDPMASNAAAMGAAGDAASQVAFAYADRNEDLVVSWEEYRNRAMRLFAHVDSNADGILQVAELKALAGPDTPTSLSDINAGTFNAAMRKNFDTGDRNSDGALTPAEWRDTVRPSRAF